jgi:hypothetical protein
MIAMSPTVNMANPRRVDAGILIPVSLTTTTRPAAEHIIDAAVK